MAIREQRFDFTDRRPLRGVHRGRDVERFARWSITELEEFFAEYVVAVYQRRHHAGLHLPGFRDLRMSPNEAYAHAVHLAGYVACPTEPTGCSRRSQFAATTAAGSR